MSYYQTMYGADDVNTQFPIERIAKINGFTRGNDPIIELGGELIRCKDCMYWGSRYHDCSFHDDYRDWDADDYCSRAKRREE